MQELLSRILTSKKAVYAAVPAVANVVGELVGIDVTQPAVLVLDAAVASLLVAQLLLDMRWGSGSDQTGLWSN